MKRVFAALSAVLVMLSVTACGDKESEGSSSKRSSAESLSGTYRVADIDGFGDSESGPIKRLIEFSDDGRFEMFLYKDDCDKEYYKEYGCQCNETGSYDVSDGEISLTFDPINTKEELIEQYPSCLDNRYRETGDTEGEEEYYENMIKNVMERRKTDKDLKYSIADDYDSFYRIDDPHYFRKDAYNYILRTVLDAIYGDNDEYNAISEMVEAYSDNIDKYSFFSSDDELNENVSNEAKENFKEYFEKVVNEKAASCGEDYTAEEGFTRNFDISKHSWLMVTRENDIYAFVVGESIDSDIFGSSSTFWRYENPNSTASQLGKEITDNFHSIRDVYNYYKSLD